MEPLVQDTSRPRTQAYIERQLVLLQTQEDRQLIYRDARESGAVLRYLQRCVAARPQALRQHIRRIYLAMQCRDSCQLCGAVADLMLVLQQRGRALQSRIIEQVAPLLQSDHRDQLRDALASADLSRLASLPLDESVLHNGGLRLQSANR